MKSVILSFLMCLVLFGCSAGMSNGPSVRSKDPQKLLDKTWQWVSTVTPEEKITAADPGRYTLLFQEDGHVRVRFDCNRGGGKYTISQGQISFGPMMSTRMACPSDSQDGGFMRDLNRVDSFFIEGNNLYLELLSDNGTMLFHPMP